ncbi:MAG TPA: hypothetical protein VMB26_08470 [Candidatus Binataceae bacterium]|nr:hypothetical protein [Candidatus Binataceae bacterium]
MKIRHVAIPALLTWTLMINMPKPHKSETQTGFPDKTSCERAAHRWRSNFERQVKEGTLKGPIKTDTDQRRRMARTLPKTECVEDANPAAK